jgi:23S rRNA G2445 N2-methylase RlmL
MIHTGSYLGVLTEHYDVMITDPPYSSRCHDGQSTRRGEIEYQCWSLDQYTELCYWAHHHVSGWWVIITDHVSWHEVDIRARAHGRYCFAPVPIVTPGLTVRLAGDGPASWAVYAHVSRPTAKDWAAWRSLP